MFAVEDSWSQEVRETTTPPDTPDTIVQITRCLTDVVPDWSPGFVDSIDLENPDPQTFTISPNPLNAVIADCYEYKITDGVVINEAFNIQPNEAEDILTVTYTPSSEVDSDDFAQIGTKSLGIRAELKAAEDGVTEYNSATYFDMKFICSSNKVLTIAPVTDTLMIDTKDQIVIVQGGTVKLPVSTSHIPLFQSCWRLEALSKVSLLPSSSMTATITPGNPDEIEISTISSDPTDIYTLKVSKTDNVSSPIVYE